MVTWINLQGRPCWSCHDERTEDNVPGLRDCSLASKFQQDTRSGAGGKPVRVSRGWPSSFLSHCRSRDSSSAVHFLGFKSFHTDYCLLLWGDGNWHRSQNFPPLDLVSTVCVCVLNHFSRVQLFVRLWTIDHQAPLSLGLSRQEYRSGFPCPPPGYLPNPGIKPSSLTSPALASRFLTTSATWETPWILLLTSFPTWFCSELCSYSSVIGFCISPNLHEVSGRVTVFLEAVTVL